MECLSPSDPCETVAVMKGAQVACTEIALNWMFYTIDYSPAPMLYVQKTLEAVAKLNRQRFDKAIESMPIIQKKMRTGTGNRGGNTARIKQFNGGIILFGGANSAASLRSMPIERLILDEEDSYDADIQEEGAPQDLAIRRTANFPRRKIFRLSTPKISETSAIEPVYEEGDQRLYYVVCPFCKHKAPIRWKDSDPDRKDFTITWEGETVKEATESVGLACANCGEIIPERYKPWMMAEENGACWVVQNPDGDYPSFHISSLYSPLGFFSWQKAVKMWLRATKTYDRNKLKVFINTVLGETWAETGKQLNPSWVEERKEDYGQWDLPEEALIVVAGVDVQDNRIEIEVVAFGKAEESWSVDYVTIQGDTARDFVWDQFDKWHQSARYSHPSGAHLAIACTGLDSGYRTEIVNKFCKDREWRRIFPVKGNDGWGRGYIERPKRRNKYGAWSFVAWVDELKSKVYSYLQIEEPGAGYCHFPKKRIYDAHYFRMLTAETMEVKLVGGQKRLKWTLRKGRRNEALDCRCYALTALAILGRPVEQLLEQGGAPVGGQSRQIPARTRRNRRRVLSRGIA